MFFLLQNSPLIYRTEMITNNTCNISITRKTCLEANSEAALHYLQSSILNLIYVSKLSQCLFYFTPSAFMHDFRDTCNEKKQFKMTASRPFLILFSRNLLSLCESLHFHGPATLFLSLIRNYHKLTQIQSGH